MAVLVFLVLSVIFMLAVQMSAFSPYNERTQLYCIESVTEDETHHHQRSEQVNDPYRR